MDPTLLVLTASSAAAAMSALGALAVVGREQLPVVALGWANALAAGLMLGPAYLLAVAGMELGPASGAAGAVLGIAFVWFTHHAAGTDEEELNRLERTDELYGYRMILMNALHAASEGVAIGAAMAVGTPFGLFMAAAMAVHNVPESTVLSAVLRGRGVKAGPAAALAVMTDVPQVLLAVVTFAISRAAPGFVPWGIGFAVGSLIYLVLAEQMPECYRQAGRRTMALVTLVAMGIVVLLGGMAR